MWNTFCRTIFFAFTVSCSPDFGSLQGGGGKAGNLDGSSGEETGAIDADWMGSQTTVTFANGRGMGAMVGPGWIASGGLDTVVSPACPLKVSGTSRCDSTTWPRSSSLCVTGSVPVVVGGDYTGNWGIEIGVDATDPPNAPIGIVYSTVTVNFTESSSTDLRIELHRSGDPSTVTYCHDAVVSGTSYLLASFNTQCYGTGGTQFSDAAKIDQVGLQATSSEASGLTLTNLCLDSIAFGR